MQPPDVTDGKFAPNAFIRIDETGKTTLVMPQVEMGQGIYTSIAMILAEELDADWPRSRCCTRRRTTSSTAIPTFGLQVTGNSNSIRAFWKPLRNAGASARAMLVQAAAAAMAGRAGKLHGVEGRGDRTPTSGRKLSYGALADGREQPDAAEGCRRSRTRRTFV